jgi:type II secretory pathway component GspD/PulD (secretin)
LCFNAITAAILFMKTLNKLSITLLGILAFGAFATPMDGAAAENTNSILSATTNLYTRTFKVDPNTFSQALESFTTNAFGVTNNYNGVGGLHYATPDSGGVVSVAAKTFFSSLGVDLTAPGKSVFFNDRLGLLFVHATDQDLDTIERVIQMLKMTAPQVHIKARFVEVQPDEGNLLDFSPRVTTSSTRGSQNSDPTIATVTGVLTDPNFRIVIHALQQRAGFEMLAEPEVNTTSGRQTQMRATDINQSHDFYDDMNPNGVSGKEF